MDGYVHFYCPHCGAQWLMVYDETYKARVQIADDGFLHIPCLCGEGDLKSPYVEKGGLIYPQAFIPARKLANG